MTRVGEGMLKLNRLGTSMLEAIAALFIISFILTTAISIIVSVNSQTIASNEQIVATQVGSQIRDELIGSSSYAIIENWMNDTEKTVTSSNCSSSPLSCDLFTLEANGKTYDTNVSILFHTPTVQSIQYEIIHFTIVITYYSSKNVELDGIVYE